LLPIQLRIGIPLVLLGPSVEILQLLIGDVIFEIPCNLHGVLVIVIRCRRCSLHWIIHAYSPNRLWIPTSLHDAAALYLILINGRFSVPTYSQ